MGGLLGSPRKLMGRMAGGSWEGIGLGLEAFIGMTKEEWDDEHMKVTDAHILALLGIE